MSMVFVVGAFFILVNISLLLYSRPVAFSYAVLTCFSDPTPLPKLLRQSNPNYKLHQTSSLTVGGYPVYSGKTCVEATTAPKAKSTQKVSLSTLGLPLVGKHYSVVNGELPSIDNAPLKEKISIKEPLTLSVSQPDEVFRYRVSVEDKSVFCDHDDKQLSCDVIKLGLLHNKQYPLAVERFFGESKVEDISESAITTIEPVSITATTIASGAMVYDSPSEVTITTDKVLASAKVELLMKSNQRAVEQTTSINDKTIHIKIAKPLDRKVEYTLVVREAIAKDKASLAREHVLPFTTSGGPKAIASSIGRTSIDSGRAIIVTFDQVLAPGQDVMKQIGFSSGSTAVPFKVSISGRQVVITPKINLPVCATFKISLSGALTSIHGVGGDSAWSITSRIKCYTISSIGTSAQGRPIYAYRFGSGVNKVLYAGNVHGDEKSTKYLLDSWIKELDTFAERIPAGKQVIIVPSVSPDGFAHSTRKNARGVDLNRNFPTNDWKSDVTMPGGQMAIGGGGATALSEPESSALASFVLSERPSRVLVYHSVASVVTANGIGDSGSLASTYSRLTRYRNLPKSDTATVFNYDTTGAFEDWLYDKVGIPALLVELGSHSNSEFSKNKSALWAMLN